MPVVCEQIRGKLPGHHDQRPDSLPILRRCLLHKLLQPGALHARGRGAQTDKLIPAPLALTVPIHVKSGRTTVLVN